MLDRLLRRRGCRAAGRFVVWVLAALPAVAETEPAADPGAAAIFETLTVVASKVEEPVGRPAGTVSVIERSELERRLVQSAADAVRYEPGVSATGQIGRFGFSSFRIRGIDGNRVALEIDGVRQPDAFAVGSFAAAGRGVVEPELLDSLEILRGPASALHGSDALGGLVELTTRSPEQLLRGAAATASVRVSADSRDRGLRSSLLGAFSRGNWRVLGLVVERSGEELANRGAVPPDPASRRDRSGFVRAVRDLDSGLLEITADREERTVATDVRHLVHGPSQFATTERLEGDDSADRSRVGLLWRFDAASGAIDESRARLDWSASTTTQRTEQERSADSRTRYPTLRRRRFELDDETFRGEWSATSRFSTGSAEHRLVWGAAATRSTYRERRDGSETNLLTGTSTTTVLGEALPVRDFPVSRVTGWSLYAADDIALGADGRWRLLPALRFDRTASSAHPDRLYREDFPATPVVDTDDASWTPKLGLVRELGSGHSVYAQYAEGFRAPPFYDVNVGLRIATFNYEAIPNPDLRPERSRGAELGWRHAGPRAAVHVAVYDNRYRDLIESRANLGRDPQSGATLFQSINRDRARIYGAEARLRVDLGRITPAAEGWSFDAGASWSRGEDTRRREPLNSVDPARLTAGLAYFAPTGTWSASAVGTWVASKRGEVDRSAADVFAPPAYSLLDLYAEWRPDRSWALSVAVLNLFDEKYWDWATAGGLLAGDPKLELHTQPGRSLLAGIAWRR